jgi:ribonuclease BN (tRNA processing enzyme)
VEIALDRDTEFLGHKVRTAEVIHQSGAPSTAVRLSDGKTLLAFSGDTEWTETLVAVAAGADLFICECYAHDGRIAGHMSWQILKRRLPDLRARRIMVTHMNPTMLARLDEVKAAGVLVAEDGMVVEV